MSASGGQFSFMGDMKENFNVIINTNHPLMNRILLEKEDALQSVKMKQAIDLALLSQNLLKGEELTRFIQKSVELL